MMWNWPLKTSKNTPIKQYKKVKIIQNAHSLQKCVIFKKWLWTDALYESQATTQMSEQVDWLKKKKGNEHIPYKL